MANRSAATYCLLCAISKPLSALTDVENQIEQINIKLTRINATAYLQSVNLPKKVCTICLTFLEGSYDFVLAVERAQHALLHLNADMKQEICANFEATETVLKVEQELENVGDDKNPLHYEEYPPAPSIEAPVDTSPSNSTDGQEIIETIKLNTKQKFKKEKDQPPLINPPSTWEDYIWKCGFCDIEFPTHEELKTHAMELHKCCNAQKCYDCNMHIGNLETFNKHVCLHKKHLSYSCFTCFKTFPTFCQADLHRDTHRPTPHYCKGCNTTFETENQLNDHMSTYYRLEICITSKSNYICETCGKCFLNMWAHNAHMKVHRESIKYNTKLKSKKTNVGVHKNLIHYEEDPPASSIEAPVDTSTSNLTDEKVNKNKKLNTQQKCKKKKDQAPLINPPSTWEDYIWKCGFCDIEFPTHEELKTHAMELHKCCNAQKCYDCNMHIGNLETFNKHVCLHKKHLSYSCFTCFKTFPTLCQADLHRDTHRPTPHYCKGCNTTFETENQLNDHMSTYYRLEICITSKSNYICETCGKCFLNMWAQNAHMRVHSIKFNTKLKSKKKNVDDDKNLIDYEEDPPAPSIEAPVDTSTSNSTGQKENETIKLNTKQKCKKKKDQPPLINPPSTWEDYIWKCGFCDTEFLTHEELKTHAMEFHKCCNAQKCYDCNIRNGNLWAFTKHVRLHRKHLSYSCFTCFKTFPSPHKAGVHRHTHTQAPHYCKGCNTTFETETQLKDHMSTYYRLFCNRTATKAVDVYCKECDKIFNYPRLLTIHMKIHTNRKRDYICDSCGKCFLSKPALSEHMSAHTNVRPFPCTICTQRFKRQIHLIKHLKTHQTENKYTCDMCNRSYKLKCYLERHMIVHTNLLPHVCCYCNKGFRYVNGLRIHLRQHTGDMPYTCSECQRQFTNWSNWNKHMKRRHNMNMSKRKRVPLNKEMSESMKENVETVCTEKKHGKNTIKPITGVVDQVTSNNIEHL